MTYFSKFSIPFDELLAQLQRNETSCTKLILQINQFNTVSIENKLEFCRSLEKNNTLTYLSVEGNPLDDELIAILISALENNNTITMIDYSKRNLSRESVNAIQAILDRNRRLALNRQISPNKLDLVVPIESIISNADFYRKAGIRIAFEAARDGDIDVLYSLVELCPDLLQESNIVEGSLLHKASKYGQVDCVKLLLQLDAKIDFNPPGILNTQMGTALHVAIENKQIVIVQLLLNAGASVSSKRNGFTPLHDAQNLEIAELLLATNRADVNSIVSEETQCIGCHGNSVLHSVRPTDLLRFFIANGAQVNATNCCGQTPLHILVQNSYQTREDFLNRLNVLIRAGANLQLKDHEGRMPLDVADPKWVEIMTTVTKDYLRIRRASLLLEQGFWSSDAAFFGVPREVLVNIARFTADSNLLDEENKLSIAQNNLSRP